MYYIINFKYIYIKRLKNIYFFENKNLLHLGVAMEPRGLLEPPQAPWATPLAPWEEREGDGAW
jgi:hypothetical protein